MTSQWYYGRPTVTRLEAYGNPLDCSGIVNMMLGGNQFSDPIFVLFLVEDGRGKDLTTHCVFTRFLVSCFIKMARHTTT